MSSFFLLERSQLNKKTALSFVNLWHRRIPRLCIPFVVWSIVYMLVNHKDSYVSVMKFISYYWIGFGWSGQYYFIALIQLLILCPWLRSIELTLKQLAIVASATLSAFVFAF